MADNGNVIIRILADTSDFEKDLARAKKGLIALGAAATAFGVQAIKSGAAIEFELTRASLAAGDTLKNIKAGTGIFKQFQDAAIAATRGTMFSSNEAAAALTALAKAGLDAETAIATLPAVLNMAQAGELELGNAAESLVNIMSSLGIGVDEAKVAIDQMAKAADATTADMSDIIEGMARIGAMGKQASGGTKELSAALAILRQNGIDAGAAGTSLRNIYTRLLGGNKQAADSFKQLGISTRDSAGNLRPLADIMSDLNVALSKLGAEQKELYITQIFDVFNATSARNLMENVGALRELEKELENATGFAQRQSEALGATFQGRIAALNKAYKDLGNTLFGEANPAMKDALGNLTGFLNEFSQSDEIKDFGAALAEVVSSLSEMGKKVLPTVVSLTSALADAVSFAARNITALTAAYVAYKVAAIAATVASKSFFTAIKAGLISTGIGAAFVALGFAIQAIIDNFDVLSIRIEQAWIWLRKLFASEETSQKLDKRLQDLDAKLQDIKKSAKQAKDGIDDIGKDKIDSPYDFASMKKDLAKYEKKVKDLHKEIARIEKENPVAGFGDIKSLREEAAEYQKIIDGIKALGPAVADSADKIKSTWEWAADTEIGDRIAETWQAVTVSIGDAIAMMTQSLIEGTNVFQAAGQMLVENMADVLSSIGDSLIIQGTAIKVAETLQPEAMIAIGIAAKALSGVIKGMIARQQAGHYAQGGIVPGTSYSGDNVPAYVNSGELILNRAQQSNLARQLTAGPAVNVQVINNAGADVSVQQGANINDVIVMIDQRIEQYVGSQSGARAIKAAANYRGY